jgi:hypothetical protein
MSSTLRIPPCRTHPCRTHPCRTDLRRKVVSEAGEIFHDADAAIRLPSRYGDNARS